nr:methionyl-tRNA formyltransferase [Propionibacterium sp.]
MRVVFAGTPEVALPSLALLAASELDLIAVVTRPDAARGRSNRPVPSPVAAWAAEHGVAVLKPERPREEAFKAQLRTLAPDACAVVAYGALLPQDVLDIPRLGWVNLHFSLLPRWRGAAPAQRTIIAGDAVAGATTFRIVKELDAGPVYRTVTHPLAGTETAGALLAALAEVGAPLLLDTLRALETAVPTPQPADGVTLAPKLTPEEARLDWSRDGHALDRLIRGCSPEPMAWTTLGGERFRVALARPTDAATLPPGGLSLGKRAVLVGTGTVDLELLRVQPQGKREMAATDWARGLREPVESFDAAPGGSA